MFSLLATPDNSLHKNAIPVKRSQAKPKAEPKVRALWRRLARPEGVEPPTLWSEAKCSIQLSYGRFF